MRHTVAMERALWEKPVDGGAISNRGKLEAAKAQVVVLLTTMKARGCKEEFEPNPTLLQNGQVSPMEHRCDTRLENCVKSK